MANFKGWTVVASNLRERVSGEHHIFNIGQGASLLGIADRIERNGLILADEVGMGKTRIAVALARAVVEAGGRVAIAIPPGLDFQWQEELKAGGIGDTPAALRSMKGYFAAWAANNGAKPWFDEPVAVISHRFGNWRIDKRTPWRWQLLPLLYAYWQKRESGRYPRDSFMYDEESWEPTVKRAAQAIFDGPLRRSEKATFQVMADVCTQVVHLDVMRSEEYGRDSQLRQNLEQVVGVGLGTFDLVIIDEAHKSRGETSGLERLIENMIVFSPGARRLAVTATPVELGVDQWKQILLRIKADNIDRISQVVEHYADALKKVRKVWQTDSSARAEFASAAARFQTELSPYLLRRDKREDETVRKFAKASKEPFDAYRRETEINIDTASLTLDWKKAICAAEALSFAATGQDVIAKRLRLTMGNGHAISSILDHALRDAKEDAPQAEFEAEQDAASTSNQHTPSPNLDIKREARVRWWQKVARDAFSLGEASLYHHPAILAAVGEIEKYTEVNQKVLIFGRFTRPLQAITALLNARAMLRSLDAGQPWPQAKIHEEDVKAVEAASVQLGSQFDLPALDERLAAQYRSIEARRERLRENMYEMIEAGLGSAHHFELNLLRAAIASSASDVRPLLARAMDEIIDDTEAPTSKTCADAFVDLIKALRDRSNEDDNATAFWPPLETSLRDSYNFQRGTFARLMYGGTTMAGRRTLQLSFNREKSFPNVLVAQSMVGREGLNLHQACRVVVLLHPEWNPGVVEQQIGRVDRIGSRWSKDLDAAIQDGSDLPRIEIRPVVFAGTYDDHNWAVLRARWSELRAQLHGVVIDQRLRETALTEEHIEWLENAAPNFRPTAL